VNRFTKVCIDIDIDADKALQYYFSQNKLEIERWFNVIAPTNGMLDYLQSILQKLADRS